MANDIMQIGNVVRGGKEDGMVLFLKEGGNVGLKGKGGFLEVGTSTCTLLYGGGKDLV